MKKVITSTLITTMISNNVTCASEIINNQSIEANQNVDIVESIEDVTEVEVKDELNDAVQSEESVDEESVQTEEEAQDSNDGELSQNTESENGVQAINQNTNTSSGATVTTTQKDVHNFTELQDALKQSNIIINIKSDIKFDAPINIIGQNITINGEEHRFDLNQTDDKNRFVIKNKASDITIDNLIFENYTTNGITVYRVTGNNIALKNITLIGRY